MSKDQHHSDKKHLINNIQRCVEDFVVGLLYSNPHLAQIEGYNAIVRKDINEIKNHQVTLLSGGGSGHEPAHAGYIGDGMLSGAILGNIFASPSVASILAAIRIAGGRSGVLLIVKNYTGDRLNFGMAMEIARKEGIKCLMVVVDDDCALKQGKGITGGRGIAGTIFVHKVAGAAAKLGYSLEKVHEIAVKAVKSMKTLGIALTTCNIPGTQPSDRLNAPQSIEIGMGIHGEPGREKSTLPSEGAAKQIASTLVHGVLHSLQPLFTAHPSPKSKSKFVLLLNNLGALPTIEMGIMLKEIVDAIQLSSSDFEIVRIFQGGLMTSLDMNGLSITILPIIDHFNDELLPLIDYDTNAPAWPATFTGVLNSHLLNKSSRQLPYSPSAHQEKSQESIPLIFMNPEIISYTLKICEKIIENEELITKYDQICGDGDCGLVLKKGSEKIKEMIDRDYSSTILSEKFNVITFLTEIADTISDSMGGTSGVLLELFFRAMSNSFIAQVRSICYSIVS
jgi:dihydroxyacetone kinase